MIGEIPQINILESITETQETINIKTGSLILSNTGYGNISYVIRNYYF